MNTNIILNNINQINNKKTLINQLLQTIKNNVNIISINQITHDKNPIVKSGGGDLYVCTIDGDYEKYIYKEFKKIYNPEIKLMEMKLRMPIWSVLNKNPYFMKVISIVTDNTKKLFRGLILENLSDYESVHNMCEKNQYALRNLAEPQRNKFQQIFVSICYYLFKLNLCSHIEHAGNIMIKKINNSDIEIKIVDPDEIGDRVGCGMIIDDQKDSLKQLTVILSTCYFPSRVILDPINFLLDDDIYKGIKMLIGSIGLDIKNIPTPSADDIKNVTQAIINIEDFHRLH